MKDAHGFKSGPTETQWPKTRHAEVFFTKEESARVLAASKKAGFTLTHIGMQLHSSMGM